MVSTFVTLAVLVILMAVLTLATLASLFLHAALAFVAAAFAPAFTLLVLSIAVLRILLGLAVALLEIALRLLAPLLGTWLAGFLFALWRLLDRLLWSFCGFTRSDRATAWHAAKAAG